MSVPPRPGGGLELPELRVVALADLVLHEDADPRRVAALALRLQTDGLVRNPPIATELGDGRHVVLDGANRVSALIRLGVPDVVVQVVDYAEVVLGTWYHLVTGAAAGMDSLQPGLRTEPCDLREARRRLEARTCAAYIVLPGGAVHCVAGSDDLSEQTRLLRELVGGYKGRSNIHRIQTDDIAALAPHYTHIAGLVVFPSYRPEDILAMARQEAKLPSGITRHLIPMRALRANTELSFLLSDTHLEEKNRSLADWTRQKLQVRAIRFYEEPTVMYDE